MPMEYTADGGVVTGSGYGPDPSAYSSGVNQPAFDVPATVSETFDPHRWRQVPGFDFTDITYHRGVDRSGSQPRDLPVVRIAFDRPARSEERRVGRAWSAGRRPA